MFNLYTGIPGSGKTLLAVLELWQHLVNGREVWSNTWINWKGDNLHYFEDPDDLCVLKDCVIFIDEIGSILDSRNYKETSREIRYMLQQHRKRGLDIISTTQHSSFVEKSARVLMGYWCEIKNLTPTEGIKGRKGIGHFIPFLIIRETPIDITTIQNEVPEPVRSGFISVLMSLKVWWKKSMFDRKFEKYKVDLEKPLYDTRREIVVPIKSHYIKFFKKCSGCGKDHPYNGGLSSRERDLVASLNELSAQEVKN